MGKLDIQSHEIVWRGSSMSKPSKMQIDVRLRKDIGGAVGTGVEMYWLCAH